MKNFSLAFMVTAAIILAACNRNEKSSAVSATVDSAQVKDTNSTIHLPPPNEKESNVKFSKVIGWGNRAPAAPAGLAVSRFVEGIRSPRNVYVAPNGDVFVSFANTETKGVVKKLKDDVTGRDESQHTEKSLNQVYLFRDTNGDGKPEIKSLYLAGLAQPFGMLVLDNFFYVANTDGLWRYPYNEKDTRLSSKGEKIVDLPAGGYNNHWTRNIIADPAGKKILIAVGSGSNVGENGMEHEQRRANILEINPDGSGERILAGGLRNPVGMDFLPGTNRLWTVVNERDELGDELVPDYLTEVKDGAFYGWPYSYFGQHVDPRIKPEDQKPELVQRAVVPDLALESHSAALGLAFYDGKALPEKYQGGAFVVQHGSWNRATLAGYKVMFVPFKNGKIAGTPEDFLSGFISNEDKGEVFGRPVSVAVTTEGNLLVTDDASDIVWFVKPSLQR